MEETLITKFSTELKGVFSDFAWFQQILRTLYHYTFIPPIPKKNALTVDNMSDLFINKRKRNLEKFLNWLALNPIIKNSKLFYDFLSIESEEELNKAKLEYQKAPKPLNLIEFYHKKGNKEWIK